MMKNLNNLKNSLVRLAFSLTVIFALSGLSFAQIKLRNALDYDGDAKADASIFRGTNSTWYILKSSDGQLQTANFGAAETDLPTQNDYDGDGKTGISVWRETNGTYYSLKSTDGLILAIQWGYTSDSADCHLRFTLKKQTEARA